MRRMFVIGLVIALFAVACSSGDSTSALEADAGADFEVEVGIAPVFDGCDTTGDATNFAWTIIEAPDSVGDDSGKVLREVESDCSFQLESAMVIDDVGAWTIELTASGEDGESSDQVVVTVVE